MIFLLIFLLELFSLFFFSKVLIKSLSRIFYYFTRSTKVTVHILAFLFLPGTVIHELAHILMAGVLLVPTGDIEFTPEIRENGVKLGSAEIGHTDPIRRALIGVAPVILGVSIIISVLYYLTANQGIQLWVFLTLFYILFETSNTMFSSKKDLEGALEVFILIIGFFIAIYLLQFNSVFSWIGNFLSSQSSLLQRIDIFLAIPIIMDILVYSLVRIFLKRV